MNKKWIITTVLFLASVAMAAFAGGADSKSSATVGAVTIGAVTADALPVFANSTGADATATVDVNHRAVVNIGSETIGLVTAVSSLSGDISRLETALAADINAVEAELSNAHANATTAATHTFAILNYLSDGTNLVPWLTAVILGDAVNGNNQAAVAPWLYDGAAWYRARSVASTGIQLNAEASPTVWEQQTITLVANTAATITSEITGTRKNILLKAQEEKPFWVSIDGDAVIGTNGTLVNDWILLDVPLAVHVSVIASEAFAISVTESGW
jgi:hypothetical protein